MTPNLQIKYRPIDALLPYARNPRTHSPAQIAKIAASIVEFGWTQPILVDGESGIIAGHAAWPLEERVFALPLGAVFERFSAERRPG